MRDDCGRWRPVARPRRAAPPSTESSMIAGDKSHDHEFNAMVVSGGSRPIMGTRRADPPARPPRRRPPKNGLTRGAPSSLRVAPVIVNQGRSGSVLGREGDHLAPDTPVKPDGGKEARVES